MAILSQTSVGDIIYYYVDDFPSHTAPKGSVAILGGSFYDNNVIFINNDGGTTWLKSFSYDYGEIFLNNGTTSIVADGDQALGSWFAFNPFDAWTTGDNGIEFYRNNGEDELRYSGSSLIRVMVTQSSTIRGATDKWINFNCGISKNFFVPTRWNGCFTNANSSTINTNTIRMLSLNDGDFVLAAISPVSIEGGGTTSSGAYIPRHCQITTIKVDEAIKKTLISENFESSGFTSGGWTVVNDSENIWVVGQAQDGISTAYISNNGGTSAAYNISNSEASHFYKDLTFVSNANSIFLTFDWKCQGENFDAATQYDYGAVVITTTGTTPVAGIEVSTVQATLGGNGRIGASTNLGKFNLAYGTTPGTVWNSESIDLTAYVGQTKRIIFTWKNDNSVGANPPFILNNIKINEYIW